MKSSKPTKVGSFQRQEKKKMAIEKKTTKEIVFENTPFKMAGEILYRNQKWISVDEIFRWAEENPEDTFEDFLAEIDYKRYLIYESHN